MYREIVVLISHISLLFIQYRFKNFHKREITSSSKKKKNHKFHDLFLLHSKALCNGVTALTALLR